MTATKPLILVDGSSYLYRAYHALPRLTNSDGQPTGAMYGVVNMLRKLINDYDPAQLAVIFDARGKTFRDDLFDAYKANRPPMPEELASQVEPLLAMIEALGVPLLQVPHVEADDVIGTLARRAAVEGKDVLISTGDKDMAQLVDDHITLLDTMKDSVLDVAGVEAKYGVPPSQIVDYLALVGDTSDNIPGVPGVGPKTAARWLRQYGSLDAILSKADNIKGKVGENLRETLPRVPLFRQLATIDCDVALDLAADHLCRRTVDPQSLKKLFRQYGFKTWLKDLDEEGPNSETKAPGEAVSNPEYQVILDQGELDDWVERLAAVELFAVDTETTSLDYMQAKIVGVSFAVGPQQAAYVPVGHDYPGAPEQLGVDAVLTKLQPLLEDPTRGKVGQNLKYDAHILQNHGIELQGIRHDTMLESYVLNSTATRHDMDSLAELYLNVRTIHYEDVAGSGARQLSFNQVPLEQAGPYAAEDADVTLKLHEELWPRLRKIPTLQQLYEEIEVPLIRVLARVEHTGVTIDAQRLQAQGTEIAKRLLDLEQQTHALAGQVFNLGSPKQLQQILFEEMHLPVLKKTPKGQPSTSEEVLQELALDFPLPKLILEHRSLSKLKSTYIDKLPLQVNPNTGRVHTSYHQAVASTGRLSSSDPNLQNIPVRTLEGRRIRQAFVAPEGCRIMAADYSQIELRIMAHLSEDERLLRAFELGEDIHRATAAEVFNVDLTAVSNEQRRSAKAINFGLIYGMSAFGLARQLGIERAAAQDYVDRYFTRYPGVKAFMDSTRQLASERGFVETVFGRRLYLPDIKASNAQRRQAAERTAINAPMQGTAADIIKRAMLAVDKWITNERNAVRMIMQVHDELVFEVDVDAVEEAGKRIRSCMMEAASLRLALEVDIGIGENWDEAH